MTTFYIEDFKEGLDVRKDQMTAVPGSLQQLDNCVITAGGEILKRKAFVQVATFPANSAGLYGYTFFQPNPGPGTWPDAILYSFSLGFSHSVTTIGTSGNVRIFNEQLPVPAGPTTSGHPYGYTQGFNAVYNNFGGAVSYGPADWTTLQAPMFVTIASFHTDGVTADWLNFWQGVPQLDDWKRGIFPVLIDQKVYMIGGPSLLFSGVGDPGDMNPLDPAGTGPNTAHPGAGYIDTSVLAKDTMNLRGLGGFYKQTAVFSWTECLLFQLDPDPALNVLTQKLRVGCVWNATIQPFGTGELIWCAPQGVRLMRALNASMAAAVSQIGGPVDPLVAAAVRHESEIVGGQSFSSVIDPDGRYWLAIDNQIFVLNFWPESKITAWSRFTVPFRIDWMATAGRHVFVRSGNTLYRYGGSDDNAYDNTVATVVTPFHAADTTTTMKKARSVSAMVRGNWALSLSFASDQPGFYELVANLNSPTYAMQELPVAGFGTHVGFKLTCSDAGPSLLGQLGVRFDKANEK